MFHLLLELINWQHPTYLHPAYLVWLHFRGGRLGGLHLSNILLSTVAHWMSTGYSQGRIKALRIFTVDLQQISSNILLLNLKLPYSKGSQISQE